jgi:hypothetical protein
VKRPGFKITLPCGPITQVTGPELAYFISLFGGSLGGNGGNPGLTNAQLNALGIILPWFPPPGQNNPPPPGTDPNNTIIQGVEHGAGTSPPPPSPPPPPPPPPPPQPSPPCIDCNVHGNTAPLRK